MTARIPRGVPKARSLQCQWCGAEFTEPPPSKGNEAQPRSITLKHADHEVKCEQNPNHPAKGKVSMAWNPVPWKAQPMGARPTPKPHLLTFLGGPEDGRQTHFQNYLVDGTTALVCPPMRLAGPVKADSQGRACSVYMGHYELRLKGDCPIYQWVDTITPKKRLPKPLGFRDLWPEATVPEYQPYEQEQPEQETEAQLAPGQEEQDDE